MWQIGKIEYSRLRKKAALLLVLLAILSLFYLAIILRAGDQNIPPQWSAELGQMTFAEIYQKIGFPQEDVCAKQYQNWRELHWWGSTVLKISAANSCRLDAKPDEIYYRIYIKGKYAPVFKKTLFESNR